MGGLSGFEELADEWAHVRIPMTSLVGTDAMTPGVVLWLDDGNRLLVGHVNVSFGTGAHCRFPCLPLVRAWRRVVDMRTISSRPGTEWATAFEVDDVALEFCEESEWPFVAGLAQKMNRVNDLWGDVLDPGLAVQMTDGRTILVGHVNSLAGVCDSEIDGRSNREGSEHRIDRYLRAVPKALFRRRVYRP